MDLSPGTLVRVKNEGSQPFTIGWDNRQWKLTPGKSQIVPIEAAVLWFGDPRSTSTTQSYRLGDTVAVIPDRESEVRRLCVKYGYVDGGQVEYLKGEHERVGVSVVPKVTVTTIDDDAVTLPTVLNDPTGESVNPVSITAADQSDLEARLEAQQRQIDTLMGLLNKRGATSQVELQESQELPEDDSHLQGDGVDIQMLDPHDLK